MITQICWNELIMNIKFRHNLATEDINDVSKVFYFILFLSSLGTPSKITELEK